MNNTQISILKDLSSRLGELKSIRHISENIKKDYKNTYTNFKKLIKEEYIKEWTINKQIFYTINTKKTGILSYIEEIRKEEFLKKYKKIKVLINNINSLLKPTDILIIFGSYTRDEQTKKSDLDMVLISHMPEETETKINNVTKMSTLKIHLLDFTYEELAKMIKEKDTKNIGNELLKERIIIQGSENFYNLLNKTGYKTW